jgi:endonuclease YncB( thermonuclease family)
MVRDGDAIAKVHRPNMEHAEFLSKAQTVAQTAGLGLWSSCGGADTPLGEPALTQTAAANSGMGITTSGM